MAKTNFNKVSGWIILDKPSGVTSRQIVSKISKTLKISKIGHINCKNKNSLRKLMLNFFHNVFMFSMNDEVVHTGYDKMSHYIFAVCANKKK